MVCYLLGGLGASLEKTAEELRLPSAARGLLAMTELAAIALCVVPRAGDELVRRTYFELPTVDCRYASIKSWMSPSSTALVFPVSWFVRKSLIIW